VADLFDIISAKLAADTGDSGVNEPDDGATGGFHRNKAPEGSTYPRIHVKLLTGLPTYTMTQEAARAVYVQFTTFAKDPQGLPGESSEPGAARAARLNKRVQTLFFDADKTANDPAFIGSRLERELPSSTEEDEANGQTIYSEGCVLKMWTA
jgi:hypothetical protein